MTTDTKLEFADWLLVRDTVAHEIEVVNSDGAILHDRQIAEALMAQGYIDIDAVLAEQRGEELDADDYIETIDVDDLVGRGATWTENGKHGIIQGIFNPGGEPVIVSFLIDGRTTTQQIPLEWLELDEPIS